MIDVDGINECVQRVPKPERDRPCPNGTPVGVSLHVRCDKFNGTVDVMLTLMSSAPPNKYRRRCDMFNLLLAPN